MSPPAFVSPLPSSPFPSLSNPLPTDPRHRPTLPLPLRRNSTLPHPHRPRRGAAAAVVVAVVHPNFTQPHSPNPNPDVNATTDDKAPAKAATLARFVSWFQGDFDNYDQAAAERAPDSVVARRARHEHIHCRVQPLPSSLFPTQEHSPVALFATYYYDGNPDIVYRRRVYTFNHLNGRDADDADDNVVQMRIYKMGFIHGLRVARANCVFDALDLGCIDDVEQYEHLDGAQITWRFHPTPFAYNSSPQHNRPDEQEADDDAARPLLVNDNGHFVGSMRQGGFTAADGLRYDDELVLTPEDLWVGERVYNAAGTQVGGNPLHIPHKMRRVRHTDDDLKWTINRDLPDVTVVPRRPRV